MKLERKTAIYVFLFALGSAWIAFDLLVWGYGESPRHVAWTLFEGTWGSAYGIGQVFYKATPLLFTGAAIDLALRGGLFNIGAEGQVAIASFAVGAIGAILPPSISSFVAVPLLILVAIVAAALWGTIPAILRGRFGAHEVISTIMMNRIASLLIGLLLGYGIALPGTVRTGEIVEAGKIARLGAIVPAFHGSAVSFALFIALAFAIVIPWTMRHTRVGREIVLVGQNRLACVAEKIPVARRFEQAIIVSAAVCGLAACATVMGYKGYYEEGLGAGVGFGGIAVALLGRGSAVGLIASAILFGTLQQGGLAINAYVPMEMIDVLQGVVIVAVAFSNIRVREALIASLARKRSAA